MPPDAWIVLPTYNEVDNLEGIVEAIRAATAQDGVRILIVDDNSPDGTGAIADRLAGEHERIEVLHRPVKQGLGPAYVAGFAHALDRGAEYVIEMDADFSHDPGDVPRLLSAARNGADVALGSRYVDGGGIENWGLARRIVSRGGCLYARTVLGVDVRDLTGGFKCFRASALQTIDFSTVRSLGYAFQVELTYRALQRGLRVTELPITFHERREGASKMTSRIALEAAWLVPRLRLAQGRPPRCR
jgi:dolichol-phosphate mannosyltransferase